MKPIAHIDSQSAVVLSIGDAGEVRVASLPGLGILKLIAWSDRPFERTKDAEDLCFLLRTYHETVGDALYDRHSDVFDAEPFHWYVASATIYGRDVGNVLRQSDPARTTVMRILKDELHDEDQSSLAIAMGRGCLPEYTERIESLKAFYGGIHEAIAGYGDR